MDDLFENILIEILNKTHDRKSFDCGFPELNDYFQYRAGQDVRRNVSTVWVAVNKETKRIVGYYSLSMAAVPLIYLDEDLKKQLPRYGMVPAARLGRLAVSKKEQGKGLGKFLVTDAMIRCLDYKIAWALFLVDAKGEKARNFYNHLGFFSLKENPNSLYISRYVIEREYFSEE